MTVAPNNETAVRNMVMHGELELLLLHVHRPHLKEGEEKAVKDQDEAMKRFRRWASQRVPGAENMNVGSGAQIRQLLFAGVSNQKAEKGTLEHERVFKVCL